MSRLRVPVGADDHVQGPRDAAVTLVEYGDFECPFCGEAYLELKSLSQQLGDRMRLVFRHYPVVQLHPHALQAAEAAEAAGGQERFWGMHDLLFENQGALDHRSLLGYATELELDLDRFRDDLDEHRFQDRIRRDVLTGARSGVHGTPTIFINGHRHEGAATAEALLQAIQGRPGLHGP
jgi:protein-disulfide isomerase